MSENNPLMTPIHGISLADYSAANAKLANNVPIEAICQALGIQRPVWEEASDLWIKRMQEDTHFTIATQMGTYFAQADQHPKLGHLSAVEMIEATGDLQRLASDRYYYEELNGARTAAYEAGLDGAQWIQDNFGISLGDFQQVAMQRMQGRSTESWEETKAYTDYAEEKRAEYAAKFSAEQGGNIADDIEF